jgi:hypothetical protein
VAFSSQLSALLELQEKPNGFSAHENLWVFLVLEKLNQNCASVRPVFSQSIYTRRRELTHANAFCAFGNGCRILALVRVLKRRQHQQFHHYDPFHPNNHRDQ